MGITVKAYAKVNLTLDIVGTHAGFHLLDSVVATVDLFDVVRVSARKDSLATVTMHGLGSEVIPQEKNNAYKAAVAFISHFNTTGADIVIEKNIPMGAGLGGSSADVSGVLNALSALYHITDFNAVKQLADSLGSDTGYLLTGGYARITGRGEVVQPLPVQTELYLLLLKPDLPVSTPQCYRRYDEMGQTFSPRSHDVVTALQRGDLQAVGKSLFNALAPAAKDLLPDVATAECELKTFAPLGAVMTGSGSCVFAVFPTEELCRYAASRYRGKFNLIQTKTHIPTKGETIWQKKD